MATVICIHGIGQQLKGEEILRSEWLPALKDGLNRAGKALPDEATVAFAFYGDLFRLHDAKAIGNPPLNASDISDPNEQALLMHWWESAALLDPNVPAPDQASKGRTPQWIQRALNAVTRSRFFAGLSQRVFIGDLKQVTRYLAEPAIREECWRRVAGLIGWDTRVVIGHSLGSVVAYEALCNLDADWNVGALVTLGSPLGIRNIVFEKLAPPPRDGRGGWPKHVAQWFNIADRGDVVALAKKLDPLFESVGVGIKDIEVNNEATAHDVQPYLSAEETGRAIVAGLQV